MKEEIELRKLEKERSVLRQKYVHPLNKPIEKLKDLIHIKEFKEQLGRCYKYRNSYGGDEYWYLYVKFLRIVKGYIIYEKFEDEGNDIHISVEQKSFLPIYLMKKEISPEKYDLERSKLLAKLLAPH